LTAIEIEKEKLRRQVRAARNALDPEWRDQASDRITDRLWSWKRLATTDAVHCYLAWRSEVMTGKLIELLLQHKKKVAVPKMGASKRLLENYYIQRLSAVSIGPFGILEPDLRQCEPAMLRELQLIFVPGVAFDRRGNRLGSGHGYYDRFLAQSAAPRIGLAFEMQIVDRVPVGDHDEKMHFIVTENEMITCGE